MRILVNSRGYSQEQDYSWLARDGTRLGDTWLMDFQASSDLYDDRSLSLLLSRRGAHLVLLVTGLETNRKDYRNRPIRNMIAWVGEDGEEGLLRGLAVRALEQVNYLQQQVDLVIRTNVAPVVGFDVDWILLELIAGDVVGMEPAVSANQVQIAKLSDTSKANLATLLRNKTLPKQEGVLVVVSENVGQDRLKAVRVWQGLSSLVQGEDSATVQKKTPLRIQLLSLLVVLLIGLAMLFVVLSIFLKS